MNDLHNLVIGLGIVAIVLLACGLIVLASVLSAAGKLRRELLGQHEQHDVHVHPNPLTVRPEVLYATQGELIRVEQHVAEVDADVLSLRNEIVANGETRRVSIEAKVEAMRKECQSNTEQMRRELAEQINAMPSRIIADLANLRAFDPK